MEERISRELKLGSVGFFFLCSVSFFVLNKTLPIFIKDRCSGLNKQIMEGVLTEITEDYRGLTMVSPQNRADNSEKR